LLGHSLRKRPFLLLLHFLRRVHEFLISAKSAANIQNLAGCSVRCAERRSRLKFQQLRHDLLHEIDFAGNMTEEVEEQQDELKTMIRDAVALSLRKRRQAQRHSPAHGQGRGHLSLKIPRDQPGNS
jgi:hypothetical protein